MNEFSFVELIELSSKYKESAIFNFSQSCGLFDIIEQTPLVSEISSIKGWDTRKTRLLLDSLVAIGVLRVSNERYEILHDYKDYLLSGSETCFEGVAMLEMQQWSNWSKIEQVLAIGETASFFQEEQFSTDTNKVSAFYKAMRIFARRNGKWISTKPIFQELKEVVDMCGGHGEYLCQILCANFNLVGEVWDLEFSRPEALRSIATYNLERRVSFKCCDLMDPKALEKTTADGFLLFDCLHYFPKERITKLLVQIYNKIPAGGAIFILTQPLEGNGYAPRASAVFSFDMLMNTSQGELHTLPWLKNEIARVGFKFEVDELSPDSIFHLLIGRK